MNVSENRVIKRYQVVGDSNGRFEVHNPAHACFDIDDLIMSSVCYYMPRKTIQTADFCDRLIKA